VADPASRHGFFQSPPATSRSPGSCLVMTPSCRRRTSIRCASCPTWSSELLPSCNADDSRQETPPCPSWSRTSRRSS
jgi:hypothetical protein